MSIDCIDTFVAKMVQICPRLILVLLDLVERQVIRSRIFQVRPGGSLAIRLTMTNPALATCD